MEEVISQVWASKVGSCYDTTRASLMKDGSGDRGFLPSDLRCLSIIHQHFLSELVVGIALIQFFHSLIL